MTIKEKLYKEFVEIKNKLNALRGENLIGGDNIEEYFNSHNFARMARSYNKEEIKAMIRWATSAYEDEVEKLRTENYFNTPEGNVEKEDLQSKISVLEEKREKLFRDSTASVNAFIKEWLGEEWGCDRIYTHSFRIGIVDGTNSRGYSTFHFGHSFDVFYEYYSYTNRFEMNYGCMGSFSLLNDEDGNLRAKYLLGMGMFATNTEKLRILKDMLDKHLTALNDIENKLDVLIHNLNHPFDKREVA